MNNGNIAVLIMVVLFSFAVPIGAMIIWKRKTGAGIICFIAGAFCFTLFAMVLENMLHSLCLTGNNAISKAIIASPVLFTLYAAFAAGLFEETGRFFAFKVLLRKHSGNECAAAYGIGHGGIEVMILLGATYAVYLLAKLGVSFGSEEINAGMVATADAISIGMAALAMFERVCAMMIQIGLSMLVFKAAGDRKRLWLYPAAIILHALIDTPAALYQYGIIRSLFVIEGTAFVMGLLSLYLGRRALYEVKR